MTRAIGLVLLGFGLSTLSAAEPFTFDPNPHNLIGTKVQGWNLHVSPDGQYLATAQQIAKKGMVRLWDIQKKQPIFSVLEPQGGTRSVLFHPNGKYLITANTDSFVRIYAVPQLKLIQQFKAHESGVNALSMDGKGEKLATAGEDQLGKVWVLPEDFSREIKLLGVAQGHADAILSIALSTKGDKLVTGSADGTVRTWLLENDKIVPKIRYTGHESPVAAVAFNNEGTKVASGGGDRRLHLWDAETGRRDRFGMGHIRGITALTYADAGKKIITVSGDESTQTLGEIRIWNASGLTAGVLGSHDDAIRAVATRGDGSVFTLGRDRFIKHWNVTTKLLQSTIFLTSEEESNLEPIPVFSLTSDRSLMAIGSLSGEIRLLDLRTGEFLGTLKGHKGEILSLAFDPQNQCLVSSAVDRTIPFWDIPKTASLHSIPTPEELIYSLVFSPSGKEIITVGSQRRAKIWTKEGKEIESWQAGLATLTALAVSSDGKRIAIGGLDRVIRIWNSENLQQDPIELRGHAGTIKGLAWSNQDTLLLSLGSDSQARVWNPKEKEIIYTYKASDRNLQSAAISPEGTYAVFGTKTGGVIIVDLRTGLVKHEFAQHQGSVNAVMISHDGQTIFSAGAEGTLKQWKAGEPALPPLARLDEHKGAISNLALSPQGDRLASTGREGLIRIYEASTRRLLHQWQAHEKEIVALAWDTEGKILLTAGADQLVRAWSDSGIKKWEHSHPSAVTSLAITSQGKTIAIAGEDQEILFLDFDRKEKFRAKTTVPALSMGFSLDGSELYAATDSLFVSWDIGNGKRDSRSLGDFVKEQEIRILSLAVAHQSDQVAFVQKGLKSTIHYTMGVGENLTIQALPQVDDVVSIALSRKGEYLVTVGRDGYVSVFDLPAKSRIRHFRAEDGPLTSVAISPDGQTIFTGGVEGVVKVWPTLQDSTLTAVAEYGTQTQISPDGKTLSVALGENLHLIPTETGTQFTRHWGDSKLKRVTYQTKTNHGNTIATGHEDGLIVLWDVSTGKEIARLESHSHAIECLAFDAKGKKLISCAKSPKVNPLDDIEPTERVAELKLWDVEKRSVIRNFDNARQSSVILFHQNETEFLTGSVDGLVRVWNLQTGVMTQSFPAHEGMEIRGLWWDADQKRLWTAATNSLKLWKNLSGDGEAEYPLSLGGGLHRAIPSPDGKKVMLTTRQSSGGLVIYDIANKKQTELSLTGPSGEMAFSADGKFLFVATGYYSPDVSLGAGGWPRYVTRNYSLTMDDPPRVVPTTSLASYTTSAFSVIHAETNDILCTFSTTRHKPAGVTLSNDNQNLIVVGTGRTIEMQVYPVEQFTRVKTLKFPKPIRGHALSEKELFIVDSTGISSFPIGTVGAARPTWQHEQPELTGEIRCTSDGKTILAQTKTGFILLDSTGKKLAELDQAKQASLSPNGKWVVVLQNQEYELWELPLAKKVGRFSQVPQEVTGIAFDKDSKRVFMASRENAIQIYDVERRILEPIGKINQTEKGSHAISPGGDTLIEARSNYGIFVHDLQKGRPIASGGNGKVTRVISSQNGQWIIAKEGTKNILWKR